MYKSHQMGPLHPHLPLNYVLAPPPLLPRVREGSHWHGRRGKLTEAECRKNCNDREGGVGEVEGKQVCCYGNLDVSHHHSSDREASMDVKPKRRGTTDTDGEKMSEK